MTAVAESAATTRWRDDPRTANTAIGSSIVYRPVTTGIPAIFAYPRTSGMPKAASVKPASTSAGTWDRSIGSSPRIAGSARSHPRWRPPGESGNVSPPPVSPAVSGSFIIPPPPVSCGHSSLQILAARLQDGRTLEADTAGELTGTPSQRRPRAASPRIPEYAGWPKPRVAVSEPRSMVSGRA